MSGDCIGSRENHRAGRSDSTRRPFRRRLEFLAALGQRMFVLFGWYVLSIGPMYWRWYSAEFVNGSPYVRAFYRPLWLLARRFPWFGEWLDFYVQMWGEWRL